MLMWGCQEVIDKNVSVRIWPELPEPSLISQVQPEA
jgi:hypothetical protein